MILLHEFDSNSKRMFALKTIFGRFLKLLSCEMRWFDRTQNRHFILKICIDSILGRISIRIRSRKHLRYYCWVLGYQKLC